MELLRAAWRELEPFEGPWVLTLGSFDGVHLGHRAILDHCRRLAALEGQAGSAAVSFVRHPRSVLAGQRSPRLLTTLAERIALLAESGVDRLVLLPFDEELSRMDYDAFVRELLLERLGMSHFVLGHDVHFGRDRGGNVQTVGDLAEREGFTFSQVASVRVAGAPISSSRIRDLLAAGEVEEAVALLGHPVLLSGSVVRGRGLGRQLGFPTANVEPPTVGKLLPPIGVYAAFAQLDGPWLPAVVNVGRAPTVEAGGALRVEAHLLDPQDDLYGRRLCLALGHRLRGERQFAGLAQLTAQIARDKEAAMAWLAAATPPSPQLQVTRWQELSGEAGA